MTAPIQRFEDWVANNSDTYGECIEKAVKNFGYTHRECGTKIKELRWWLETNGHLKRIKNRKDWKRFLMNWLKPKSWEKKKVEQSRISKFGD